MISVLYVALGGAIGTVLRFGLSGSVYVWVNSTLPWGTFVVNLSG